MRNHVKQCSGCKRHLLVALPSSLVEIPDGYRHVAFNRKTGTNDGLQPWCRTCDWGGKATLDEAWNRFQRELTKEPESIPLWSREKYFEIIGNDPICHWCGARCREWGIGHWIDRITSTNTRISKREPHIPSNAVVCCTPCNMHKGQKRGDDHARYLDGLLAPTVARPSGRGVYPWGKIPWNDYPSSVFFKRVAPPDLSMHVVPDPQLSLFGGTA